jgi:magnesium transporter
MARSRSEAGLASEASKDGSTPDDSTGDGTAASPIAGAPPRVSSLPEGCAIRVAVLDGKESRDWEGDDALDRLPAALKRSSSRIWVDITAGTSEVKQRVAGLLGLHPLLAEDITERDQRAKFEQIDGYLHIVLFSLGMDDGQIYERELDFVLGERVLLTNHSRWWDPRQTHHLRGGVAGILARGVDHLVWSLADDVIDGYFPILDQLGDEIDDLEDMVVASADRLLLERLFELKRELISIRRVISPEREVFNVLSSREMTVIKPEARLYFRDAYDHLIRLTDELDTYRELASAALETYLSTVNNNLSLIMKRLTGVTVVVAGIGAIAGIFGMSEAGSAFRLSESAGFWIVTFASLVLAGIAVWVLRRIDWI